MWETLFDRMLRTIFQLGRISVTYPSGREETYGDGTGDLVAIQIHTTKALRQLMWNPELHSGEAYMDGTLTIKGDDVRGFLAMAVRSQGEQHATFLQVTSQKWRTWTRRASQMNPVGVAKNNVAHHYDLSSDLYDLFLDDDKQYSCAYFRTPEDTLEQAQAQKKAHIAKKLMIEPGMKVLDIGCGWGGMALTLARDYGAEVVGVTLSEEQHSIACARAQAEGLSDKVSFRLQDYRHVPETYDRIVSVGMFEHVGVPNYDTYFARIRDLLTDDGIALVHTIGRVRPPNATNAWVLKYIFPGGYIPSLNEAVEPIQNQGLYPTDLEIWRLHYAETLRHWYERFMVNNEAARDLYDARFCRMWRWYLAASEMSFRHFQQCVFQFQLAKHQESVPMTRDYLYANESA